MSVRQGVISQVDKVVYHDGEQDPFLTEPHGDLSRSLEERVQSEAQTLLVTPPPAPTTVVRQFSTIQAYGSPQPLDSYSSQEARKELFLDLKQKTEESIRQISYLGIQEVYALYCNIPCPRQTAVQVGDKFIHANYISDGICPRIFVASQRPCALPLFWKFILENQYAIVDLTPDECHYAPDQTDKPLVLKNVSVQLAEKKNVTSEETMFEYEVSDVDSKTSQRIQRLHFRAWRDACAVEVSKLKYLISMLEGAFQGKTLIHCKAGVGRTGTLIAAYFLKRQILQGQIRQENLGPSLVNLIVLLRRQRGQSFVQTEEQFYLLLDYARDLMKEFAQ